MKDGFQIVLVAAFMALITLCVPLIWAFTRVTQWAEEDVF